jgi:hypothetical protein
MTGGTLCFKEQILSVVMSYMGKRWVVLYRSGNERIFSNLAGLMPIPNSSINFESKEVTGV